MAEPKEPWGECARSGKRLPLSKLVRDGRYPNLLVAPEWYEPFPPQEKQAVVKDDITVKKPSPELAPLLSSPAVLTPYISFPQLSKVDFNYYGGILLSLSLGQSTRLVVG